MESRLDARTYLVGLIGKTIQTYTGRPNTILDVQADSVVVGTSRSPTGTPVPIAWVQDAIDRLFADKEVEISVPSLGYRSAFVGAVLLSIPGTRRGANPARVVLAGSASSRETT